MMKIRKALAFLGYAAATLSVLVPATASSQEKFRISLDTNPTHVRNQGVDIFAKELKKRVGDKLDIEVYPSGQVYRDRDVPKALRQNAIEMGVPGTWQLDGLVPNVALQTLPMFYGVDPDTVHTVMDGKLGDSLNERMEDRLKVKILGKWADLGMQHFYSTTKEIKSYDDLKGMKIRFSGGTANAERLKFQGVIPTLIPYPDLPLAMSQGVVQGVATTHESAATAKLYDSGLKYAFEDNQFMGQYVPMIRLSFWDKQPKEIQDAILESWEIAVTQQRKMAGQAQEDARKTLMDHGVKMAQPSAESIAAMRSSLMSIQPGVIKEMKIDQDMVDIAMQELRAAKVKF
jgi:C4-dicarboxylate-binding protein DctP